MRCIIFAVVVLTAISGLAYARGGGGHGGGGRSSGGGKGSSSHSSRSSHSGSVHVRGYTRKDGTQVRAHDRSHPGGRTFSGSTVARTGYRTAYRSQANTFDDDVDEPIELPPPKPPKSRLPNSTLRRSTDLAPKQIAETSLTRDETAAGSSVGTEKIAGQSEIVERTDSSQVVAQASATVLAKTNYRTAYRGGVSPGSSSTSRSSSPVNTDCEEGAEDRLASGRRLLKKNDLATAKKWFESTIRYCPGSKAAREAKAELDRFR